MKNPFDICAASSHRNAPKSVPSRSPIYPSTAYVCSNPELADSILAGDVAGYAYQRDGHPNADWLSQRCADLHGMDEEAGKVCATITSSGMAALTLAAVSQLKAGDHVLLSSRLYGKTTTLIRGQLSRFGVESDEVDACELDGFKSHFRANTRMVIVETISNPQFRVVDIQRLAEIAHQQHALLLVDNTFATPIVCRPLSLGADLVLESITKFMNGHGDLMLGALCGREEIWKGIDGGDIDAISSTWGLVASPFDCWLAERGMSSLGVRMLHAAKTTLLVAEFLGNHDAVRNVRFPGLPQHPDHEIANNQFETIDGRTLFANLLSFDLKRPGNAEPFIRNVEIPFCPSLGETSTTLSHPGSTSHRLLNDQQLSDLDISRDTIRLSIGLESAELLLNYLQQALDGLD